MKKAPVGIGIIGTGFARTTQIPGFRDCMGAKIVAIASAHRERAEAVAKEFDIDYVAPTGEQLVQRNDVDLVSIVTPPATHMEITLAALEHRKAVLCEKPMAMNAGETARMVEKARDAGVLALIDHELRFLNSRRTMRGMLQTGAIGTGASLQLCISIRLSRHSRIARGIGGLTKRWAAARSAQSDRTLSIRFAGCSARKISQALGLLSTHIKQRHDKAIGEAREVTTDDEAKLMFRFADGPLTEGATGAARFRLSNQASMKTGSRSTGRKAR